MESNFIAGFNILVMENAALQTGSDILMLSSEDYKRYYEKWKNEQDKNPICQYCGKYKTSQGNGIVHQLCECGTTDSSTPLKNE